MKPLGSVLLVEDDPLVGEVLRSTLALVSDHVTLASDGHQALVALQQGAFSAVVSDLRIPGPNGLTVLMEAHRLQPSARLVMISGYADEATAEAIRERGGVLVHKPFGAAELFTALGCSAPWQP